MYSCCKKKNVRSLKQEKFPWHQKTFLREFGMVMGGSLLKANQHLTRVILVKH